MYEEILGKQLAGGGSEQEDDIVLTGGETFC